MEMFFPAHLLTMSNFVKNQDNGYVFYFITRAIFKLHSIAIIHASHLAAFVLSHVDKKILGNQWKYRIQFERLKHRSGE